MNSLNRVSKKVDSNSAGTRPVVGIGGSGHGVWEPDDLIRLCSCLIVLDGFNPEGLGIGRC